MERLRRDVLQKKRDTDTMNVQRLLNVVVTNNFKFIHLVSARRTITRFEMKSFYEMSSYFGFKDVMTSTLTFRGVSTFVSIIPL